MNNWKNLWSTLKRLLNYSTNHQKSIIIAIFMLCFASLDEVTGTMIISYFIDNFLTNQRLSIFIIIILLITFIILQIKSVILRYYQSLKFNKTSIDIVQQLRIDLMNTILRQPIKIFDNKSVGQLISCITNDTEVVKDLFLTVISSVLRSIALIIAMLIAMFLLNYQLACVSLLLFPLVFLVMWLYQYYCTPIVRKLRSYVAKINSFFNETISGMLIIQQFCQQKRFANKLKRASNIHFKLRMLTLKLDGYLLRPLLNLLFSILLCSILLIFSFNKQLISVGVLYAFINYLSRLNEPLIELTSQQSIIQQAIVAGERIFKLMDSPIQQYGLDDKLLNNGNIVIRNLNFSYNNNINILNNINITIPDKYFIALVGHTGSGKSTLANLIMGNYPISKNTIFLDNRSIETLTHKVIHNGILMVQQDPVIMADTIYENLSLGSKIKEHDIWTILKQIKLASLVHSLPNGLFTKLGEYGNSLSAGQRQLLTLARALILHPKILILDEATSNIDYGTELAIAKVINKIRKNLTLIVIAHRLSTIIHADKIVVLRKGSIIECGTHDYLLKKRNYYYKLYKLQKFNKI
ncbi:MAG: SmdB family multidrug efflux ABC transporter permease/ATP-binding protein [Candidatus Lightella neohaematopini]|nr:SmdB family multidrug efflux ABC transporter permease/ATP-binding protein [Candidatus Lightella neohaematopini]